MKQPDQSNVNRSHEQRQHQQLQQAFPFLMMNGRSDRPNSNALLCLNLSNDAHDHFNHFDTKRRLTPQELRSTLEEALRLIEEDLGESSSCPFDNSARMTTTCCHSVTPLERRRTSYLEEDSSTRPRSRTSLRYGNNQDETEEHDTDADDTDDDASDNLDLRR